jgi:A/G-specific adenine glycosylase
MQVGRRAGFPATEKGRRRKIRVSLTSRAQACEVAEAARTYYRTLGRHFSWRDEQDRYRLAVAEILLQKTRAESIPGVYSDLIASYPTATELASAEPKELERRLRPLGLSRKRTVQLIGMASAVVAKGDSIFDDWRVVLAEVPGLGSYGARAITCFAAGERVGIVDANVARILRRVFRIETDDPRAAVFQKYADIILENATDARSTNFGLLDIGAIICKTRPLCARCPLGALCARYGVQVAAEPRGAT